MDKNELLKHIQSLASQQAITREEIDSAFDAGVSGGLPPKVAFNAAVTRFEVNPRKDVVRGVAEQPGISSILYYIGGAVVFLGIVVLIWQHWERFNGATKILCTLGSSIASYIAAVFLSRDERSETISGAFYLISALVMPFGLNEVFNQAGFNIGSHGVQSVIAGIAFTVFILSYIADNKTIFLIFSMAFGTWLFFSFTNFLVGSLPDFGWKFYAYRVLFAAAAYLTFGYYFSESAHKELTSALYGIGICFFLGAALVLGGWKPDQNWFWELIFPGLTFGAMFLSVHLKSSEFLTFGSLYLIAYIFKISGEYFADTLGWPFALVLAGLGLIGIGYLHFDLKKKYLS